MRSSLDKKNGTVMQVSIFRSRGPEVTASDRSGRSTSIGIDLNGLACLAALGPAVQSLDGADLAVTGTCWQFGAVTIADLTLTSFDHRPIPDAPLRFLRPGSVSVVFVQSGAARVCLGESTYFFVAGSAALIPTAVLPQLVCGDPTRVLVVSLNESTGQFEGLLPDHIVAISSAVVRTHPAAAFFLALAQTASTHPVSIAPIIEIVTRLMAGLMEADQDWHTRPDRPELTHVLNLIAEHHTEAGFDRRALARANRMTPRALDRLLVEQAENKSAEWLIAERRLISAAEFLRPGCGAEVEEIADRCGFPSPAALDAVVEHVYGVSATRRLATLGPEEA